MKLLVKFTKIHYNVILFQQMSLSNKNEFRNEILCFERGGKNNQEVKANKCADGNREHHKWHYNKVNQIFVSNII